EMQRAAGLEVDVLTPDDLSRRWPYLAIDRLIGATWCQSDGFLFPPVIYGEGIRRARDLGARVLQWTPLLGARVRGNRIDTIDTGQGPLDVDWVINCTNAWAPRVSAALGGMQLPIEPVKRFLYYLDPGGGGGEP